MKCTLCQERVGVHSFDKELLCCSCFQEAFDHCANIKVATLEGLVNVTIKKPIPQGT